MSTIKIYIDFPRSQKIGIAQGHVDALIVCEFTDERGRDRTTVSVNGHEFTIARPAAPRNDPIEWASQEQLVAAYKAGRRELNRAGGDATLLRR